MRLAYLAFIVGEIDSRALRHRLAHHTTLLAICSLQFTCFEPTYFFFLYSGPRMQNLEPFHRRVRTRAAVIQQDATLQSARLAPSACLKVFHGARMQLVWGVATTVTWAHLMRTVAVFTPATTLLVMSSHFRVEIPPWARAPTMQARVLASRFRALCRFRLRRCAVASGLHRDRLSLN